MPRVSVILPTRNRAEVLPRAIGSVLGQSFPDFELIVVDDGSTDGTDALIRDYTDPRLIYLQPPDVLGDAGARNRGIAIARGEWLAFQDSDGEWTLHKLEHQVAYATRLPDHVAVVGGTVLRMSRPNLTVHRWPLSATADPAGGMVDITAWIADGIAFLPAMLIRRSVLARRGFDGGLKARSDVELCFQLLREHAFAAVREPVALVHETPGRPTSSHQDARDDLRYLLEKHGDLLARDPRVHARYLYRLAHADLMCGDMPASRRTAWRAVRTHPPFLPPWAYLALSVLGAQRAQARVRRPARQKPNCMT